MEAAFRTLLLGWLRADPVLSASLNTIAEEAPTTAPAPALAIAASAGADWSNKSLRGRDIRMALELVTRGDRPEESTLLADALEHRMATMPPAQQGIRVVVTQFLRSRSERRARNLRATLIEYRFLILET